MAPVVDGVRRDTPAGPNGAAAAAGIHQALARAG
jgi:hypothetical protein